jgi:hypothetical protein
MLMSSRRLFPIVCLLLSGAVVCGTREGRAQSSAYTDARACPSTAGGLPYRCGSGVGSPRAEPAQRATHLLAAHGFANVAALADGECLLVTYENARYRDDRRALAEATALLAPFRSGGRCLVLVPTYRAIPLATIHFGAASTLTQVPADSPDARTPEISLDVSRVPAALFAAPLASSSFGRIDVVVHPWFQAVFGDYDNPIASRTGVAPELRMDLRPGLSVSAQVLVTLQDNLGTGESRVRPGRVTVNQIVRLPRNVFVSATAGTFNPDRWGVDVEARAFFANGRASVGTQLGLTGAASYAREGWSRTHMRGRTALVDAGWRVAPYDLLLRATAGAFLEDERAVRLDLSRRFGEVEIGWFVLAAGEGTDGGVVLRVPLLPRTYGRPGPVRVRAARSYRWQYRYRGFVPGGWRYDAGRYLWDSGSMPEVLNRP